MLTTEASKASKEMARDQGVLAWITKPFKPEKVVSVVVKVLEKRA
jgi:AmiR/NasT family two-component response regulator